MPVFSQAPAPRAILNQYCVGCHNQKLKTAGLTLDMLDVAHVGDNAQTWEKVVRKLRAGMMPPSGVPHPDTATFLHPLAQGCARRCKDDDGGTMFEPAHLFPSAQAHIAGDDIGPAVTQMQQHIEKS